MGVHQPSSSSNTLLNQPIVTTAETVVLTSPSLNPSLDNALVLIFWEVVFTLTAGTTAITARLRRGTTTGGTLINVAQAVTVTASTTVRMAGCYFDTPGVVASQQWSLTLQATAAAANTTVNDGSITALVP